MTQVKFLFSDNDKAHLRLAAAKAILRLASRWDKEISPETWLSAIFTAQVRLVLALRGN